MRWPTWDLSPNPERIDAAGEDGEQVDTHQPIAVLRYPLRLRIRRAWQVECSVCQGHWGTYPTGQSEALRSTIWTLGNLYCPGTPSQALLEAKSTRWARRQALLGTLSRVRPRGLLRGPLRGPLRRPSV